MEWPDDPHNFTWKLAAAEFAGFSEFAANRSTAVSSLRTRRIFLRRSGRTPPQARPTFTSFTASWNRRRLGREVCSLATLAFRTMAWPRGDGESAWSVWTASTFMRCWSAGCRWITFWTGRPATPPRPGSPLFAFENFSRNQLRSDSAVGAYAADGLRSQSKVSDYSFVFCPGTACRCSRRVSDTAPRQ